MPTGQEISRKCSKRDVSFVRLLWVDNGGVVRGKTVSASSVASAVESGVVFPKSFQSFTCTESFDASGPFGVDDEALLIPDPETFRVLPYADDAAVLLCDLRDLDGEPAAADPRSRLSAFLDRLDAEGFTPKTAFESEFYLARETEAGLEPYDDRPNLSADGMQSAHAVVRDVVDALTAQGVSFESYCPELGPGQQEIVVGHEPGVTAPDTQVVHRQTVKGVAADHGLRATFSPLPFEGVPASGCHLNVSLWRDGENAFHDAEADGAYALSETGRQFVAGVLAHAPALVALTAPNVVSYRRIREHSAVSAYVCWGEGNREAMVRVPATKPGDRAGTTRVEFKPADNTANPYLALLGVLAAGMDGVRNSLDPGDPVEGDPADLPEDDRAERGVERLPTSLGDALDRLEADSVLTDALGEPLAESYLSVKRHQWEQFAGLGDPSADEIASFRRPF